MGNVNVLIDALDIVQAERRIDMGFIKHFQDDGETEEYYKRAKEEAQAELQRIETHIEVLMDEQELIRIGADKQPQRDLHHRIMRILAAYTGYKQKIKELEAANKSLWERVGLAEEKKTFEQVRDNSMSMYRR